MDTTAEAFVGAGNNNQGLLAFTFEGLGLGVFEHGVGGLSILPGVGHCTLGTGKLGGSDDFHRVRDLLDVADGLQSVLNLAESRERRRILGSWPGHPT